MFEANSTKEIICDDAERQLTTFDEDWRDRLWNLVYLAFQQWKEAHGDRHPQRLTGLFAPMRLSDLVPNENTIPFEEAEPWQCAGFVTPCPTKLAIKLWQDEYQPFLELTSAVGMRFVLAMLICRFKDSPQDYLFEAHRYMNQMMAMESIGIKLLDEHRPAIEAHKTRKTGGDNRAKQLKEGEESKHQRIRNAEKELPSDIQPHHVTKTIAKTTGLETDYVRKARKKMERKKAAAS